MPTLFRMRGVGRRVGRGGTVVALREASFDILPGEFVAVVGPSGSGKTTLLSILGLLDKPTEGTFTLDGVDVATLGERERDLIRARTAGFVFQNAYLVGSETAGSNVALGLRVRGVPSRARSELVAAALRQVGLADAVGKRAGDLSGGEKQRVAVARALVTSPRVILADEPTGALDTESTKRLIGLLTEINAAGTTVVVVTHDPLVASAAGRVLEIVDGVLRDSGPKSTSSGTAPS